MEKKILVIQKNIQAENLQKLNFEMKGQNNVWNKMLFELVTVCF